MISEEVRQELLDILANTDSLDKISVKMDDVTRDVVITWEHMGRGWFSDLKEIAERKKEQ